MLRPQTLRQFERLLLKRFDILREQCRTDAAKEAGLLKMQITQLMSGDLTSRAINDLRELNARYGHMGRLVIAQKKHGEQREKEPKALSIDIAEIRILITEAEVPLFKDDPAAKEIVDDECVIGA